MKLCPKERYKNKIWSIGIGNIAYVLDAFYFREIVCWCAP